MAIEKDGLGVQHLILAAADTSSALPSKKLIERLLLSIKDLSSEFGGRSSLLSSRKAMQALPWKQADFWQDYI